MRLLPVLALALLTALGIVDASVDGREPPPSADAGGTAPAQTAALAADRRVAARAPGPAVAATADAPAPDRSHHVELPDGSSVPALNGAVDASPLATYWGPYPWSPIVAIERSSAGLDWFRHQDGSYSTTQMVWRQDLGRYAAMTRVAHPGPATPAPQAH